MMNDEWQREREQTTKRVLLQCVSVHHSLARSLYSSRVSLHQTLLFSPVFQCTLLNLIIGLVPASFTPLFFLLNIPTRLRQHFRRSCSLRIFFLHLSSFFFLPLFLTHTHSQMLSRTLSVWFLYLFDIRMSRPQTDLRPNSFFIHVMGHHL